MLVATTALRRAAGRSRDDEILSVIFLGITKKMPVFSLKNFSVVVTVSKQRYVLQSESRKGVQSWRAQERTPCMACSPN